MNRRYAQMDADFNRLERFELTKFFQRVIISDAIGVAKPEPAAFTDILKHTGRPAAALLVDDFKGPTAEIGATP